jgi:hypothetical protein
MLPHRPTSSRSRVLLIVVLIAVGSLGGLLVYDVYYGGGYASSSIGCVGVAPAANASFHYIPPCYGHDEPTISFISNSPDSGSNDRFQMVLPSSTSGFPQAYYYAAMWFGGVLYDNKSLDNQAFLELQFYPSPPTATGPNSGSQDCTKNGGYSYLSNSAGSNQWFACAIAWAINPSSGSEYAAIGLPVDVHGGTDSIMVMNSNDVIQVASWGQAKSTTQGLRITVSDSTMGSYSVVTLQNSSVVLSPFYSTAASGNVLQWGAAQPGQVSFAYEIGHTLGGSSCAGQGAPGDGRCWSYWPGRWASSGQNQLFVPEMGDLSGAFPTNLAFSSSQGGNAEINSSACHGPSNSNATNCEYPYYMFLASNGAFTFGTTDVPGTTSDFGGANQFPTVQAVNTVSMIQAAHASFISASGVYAANLTYSVGREMRMSVSVPSTTSPVSLRAFINGTAGNVHPWDIGATGSNYVIDFGPAPNQVGRYYVSTVATFNDSSTVRSSTDVVIIVP